MARKPNVPCSDGCGTLCWAGSSGRYSADRRCRPCRRKNPAGQAVRTCHCGKVFRASSPRVKSCSRQCSVKIRSPYQSLSQTRRPCVTCPGQAIAPAMYCVECRPIARRAHYRRKNAVRRGAQPVGRRMSIAELGERDNWTCHLCRRRVGRTFRAPHPRSATFDHLIPVSDGGTDAPDNLRLAHWGCNSSRGNRGTVQLLLVG